MNRRDTVVALFALAVVPRSSLSQQLGTVRRIGYLAFSVAPNAAQLAFFNRLRELGYVEGSNLVVERRVVAGSGERVDALVRDLVRFKVEVIVAVATPAAQAARRVTASIPVVFLAVVDPVGAGLTGNLARPDGNATGLSMMSAELSGKRLELLREIAPGLTRVAVLGNPGNASNAIQFTQMREAAEKLNVHTELLQVKSRGDFDAAFAAALRQRSDALIVLDDPLLATEQAQVEALASRHRIPAMYGFPGANALVSYGTSLPEHYRRAAAYVDRILKGAKPAELPVEQPTRFDLAINLRAARSLGLTIPHSVLLRADRVIE